MNFATWLFERLKDEKHPVRVVDLILDAREAGMLMAPTSSCPKPSISPLYNAMRRLPSLHPEWTIDELKIDKLKAWQLVKPTETPVNGSTPPF